MIIMSAYNPQMMSHTVPAYIYMYSTDSSKYLTFLQGMKTGSDDKGEYYCVIDLQFLWFLDVGTVSLSGSRRHGIPADKASDISMLTQCALGYYRISLNRMCTSIRMCPQIEHAVLVSLMWVKYNAPLECAPFMDLENECQDDDETLVEGDWQLISS